MTTKRLSPRALLIAVGMLLCSLTTFAQFAVTGTVIDDTDEPLLGVSVMEVGTSNGVSTDLDGNFSITVKSGEASLSFSYVGMNPQTVKINGRHTINVTMTTNSQVMDEVVVVGYGTQKKSDITGSVASIGEDAMRKTIVTNADQMLQGKLAGVQVTQNSGAPGGATSVRIRGASSLTSSNEPLYVIDGVPMSTANNEIGGFDWAGGTNGQRTVNPLASIAPSDIVSIDVLKDASACAIYGAAGANGVVLVTTRRGSEGRANITYDGYVAWQTTAKRLDMMNLREYAVYQNNLKADGIIGDGNYDPTFSDPSILGTGTDWQDEIFRTAFMQSHQVGLTGGNEKTTYAMSTGWMKQDGIIIGSDFDRFNSRFNLDHNFTSFLKLGGSLAYTRTNEKITLNDGSDGVIMQAMTMQPSVPVRDFEGNWAGPTTVNGSSSWNPVALALDKNNTLLRQRIMGNFYVSVDFLKNFTFRAEYAFDASQNQNDSYSPRYDFGNLKNDINQMYHREDHSFYWMQKDYVTYHKLFGGKHDVTAMAGFEASKSSWNGTWLIKKNFTTDKIPVMTGDGEFVNNGGWKDAASTASFFGRVNYGFDNRYLLTATLRADGSSKFGPENKWGYFPSVALAWRINQEKWLQDIYWLNNLKLRLGYGEVGNSNIDTYRYAAAMAQISTSHGTAFFPQNLANSKLKWESSVQYNVGIDFAAFQNRLELTLEAYSKETKDLLLQVFAPGHIGVNSDDNAIQTPYANIGKTQNRGFDISIVGRPIVTKDWNWTSNLTMSFNRNKIVALNDDKQVIYGNIDWYSNFQTVSMFQVGQPMGVFYGYETEGIFRNAEEIRNHATQTGGTTPYANSIDRTSGVWPGDIKFKDQNGDGVIDSKDQVVIGDPNPDLTYGWTNTVQFKDWELSIGLQGQFGGKILNWVRYRTEGRSSIWDNQDVSVLGGVQLGLINPDGSNTDPDNVVVTSIGNGVPRFSSLDGNGNNRMSDRWLEDATYLRIQNISLSYNLPEKWCKKAFLSSARIYVNVQNVHTFTKYSGFDPEIGAYNQSALLQNIDRGRYPTPRTYTVGLNLSF